MSNQLEAMILELAAYAERTGRMTIEVVMDMGDDKDDEGKAIVERIKGLPMTDSDIDDLTDYLEHYEDDEDVQDDL